MSGPPISGVHHLKFPVGNLARSRDWYESVLGLNVQAEFRDDDGVVRGVAGTLTDPEGAVVVALALRQNPEVAAGLGSFDPLALSVPDLDAWANHLTTLGFDRPRVTEDHEPPVMFLHDPDGHEIRLFGPES